MDEADLGRGAGGNAADKGQQIGLVGMGGIAAEGVDAAADCEALAIQFDPAAAGPITLNRPPRGARGLVAPSLRSGKRIGSNCFCTT
jgi:hypothetical protein